jgi:uncharacterized protein YbcI
MSDKTELSLPRLESTAGLVAAGAGADVDLRDGALRSAVANAMVGMKKQFYGKGPTRAKAFFNDDYLFVAMEDGLTRNEETLLAAGEAALVRTYRLRFQEAMAATTISAIEELVGRRVLTYHSQIVFEPTRAFEIFVLEPR